MAEKSSAGSARQDHIVAKADEIGEGERLIVQLQGRDVGIFNIDGELRAYTNWCPHMGGPLCQGRMSGTTEASFDRETLETDLRWVKDGQVVVCPWHAWEFDLESGRGVHDPEIRLPSHPVRVEDDQVIVTV